MLVEITWAIGEEWPVEYQEWRQTKEAINNVEQEVMLPNPEGSGDAETKTEHQDLPGVEGGAKGIKSNDSIFDLSLHEPSSDCNELWE